MPWYIMVLSEIGFFCVGFLFGMRRTLFWRIEWIKVEHNLARLQNRLPRTTTEMEKKK